MSEKQSDDIKKSAPSTQTFQIRKELKRELTYRLQTRHAARGALMLWVLCSLPMLIVGGQMLSVGQNIGGGIAIGITLILFVGIYMLIRHLHHNRVESVNIDGERIEVKLGGQTDHFNVGDVKSITLPENSGLVLVRLNDGREFSFSIMLERPDYLLDALIQKDRSLVAGQSFLEFRLAAIFADHSWARLYDQFRNWVGLPIFFVGVPAIFLLLQYFARQWLFDVITPVEFIDFAVIFTFNALLIFFAYGANEARLFREFRHLMRDDPTQVRRNLDLERDERRRMGVHYMIGWAISIGFWALWNLNSVSF